MTKDESKKLLEQLSQELDDLEDAARRIEELRTFDLEIGGIDNLIQSGAELIAGDEFEDYCVDLAVELGLIKRGSELFNYVDWGEYAEKVKGKYSSIKINGRYYYVAAE